MFAQRGDDRLAQFAVGAGEHGHQVAAAHHADDLWPRSTGRLLMRLPTMRSMAMVTSVVSVTVTTSPVALHHPARWGLKGAQAGVRCAGVGLELAAQQVELADHAHEAVAFVDDRSGGDVVTVEPPDGSPHRVGGGPSWPGCS